MLVGIYLQPRWSENTFLTPQLYSKAFQDYGCEAFNSPCMRFPYAQALHSSDL